jgi:hypothetical protein
MVLRGSRFVIPTQPVQARSVRVRHQRRMAFDVAVLYLLAVVAGGLAGYVASLNI